ncbi:hypothetical protein GCM10009414_26850 [Tatumella terrea]
MHPPAECEIKTTPHRHPEVKKILFCQRVMSKTSDLKAEISLSNTKAHSYDGLSASGNSHTSGDRGRRTSDLLSAG